MNHLEQRHFGMLLREGHRVTTKDGQQYEVYFEARGGRVICAKKDENSGEILTTFAISLNEIVLDENQITLEDRERVAQQIETRRQEFLRSLPQKLQKPSTIF